MLFTAELYNTVCQIYHENATFHNSSFSHNVPDHFVSVHINTAYIFKNNGIVTFFVQLQDTLLPPDLSVISVPLYKCQGKSQA